MHLPRSPTRLKISQHLGEAAATGCTQLQKLNHLVAESIGSLSSPPAMPIQGMPLAASHHVSGVSSFGYNGTIAHAALHLRVVSA